jgi:nucleoside recognition membrane protein YjiH
MGETSKFFELLKVLAEELPSLIAMIVCIGFAISRRKRYPKVSVMIIISLVLFILHVLVFNIIYTWVPGLFLTWDNSDPVKSRNFYLVLGLISNIFAALCMAVLLASVFIVRTGDARVPDRSHIKA